MKQTTPDRRDEAYLCRVIHPCHPLHGYEFEVIRQFNSLGTIRVEFLGPDGQQMSLPASCTSLSREDPYRAFTAEDGLFRYPDLIEVAELLRLMVKDLGALE